MRLEISELHEKLKTTMVYVTHDQVEAMTMAGKIVVLSDGNIEQVGSPLELYRAPINRFVAEFIGSPKMNFLTGDHAAKHNASAIGIRPEHFNVSSENGDWRGVVGVSEHLGSDTFFRVDVGGETLTARVSGEINVHHGDTVFLSANPEHIYRFNENGLAIS
ncbi:UNVERIFIED_CONTAM: hypothetical protein GTU68_038673 [Idotea baltica]|nr:hypothetical protein [Idotea baltica]